MDETTTAERTWTRCTGCDRFRSFLDDTGLCLACQVQDIAPTRDFDPTDTLDLGEAPESELEPMELAQVVDDLADVKLIVEAPKRRRWFRRRKPE